MSPQPTPASRRPRSKGQMAVIAVLALSLFVMCSLIACMGVFGFGFFANTTGLERTELVICDKTTATENGQSVYKVTTSDRKVYRIAPGILTGTEDGAYDGVRTDADTDLVYGQIQRGHKYDVYLNGLGGRIATKNLWPIEDLGLGGPC